MIQWRPVFTVTKGRIVSFHSRVGYDDIRYPIDNLIGVTHERIPSTATLPPARTSSSLTASRGMASLLTPSAPRLRRSVRTLRRPAALFRELPDRRSLAGGMWF